MIRVVMLDLGGTLVQGAPLKVLPNVPQALEAIGGMTSAAGQPFSVCLVSDFRPTAAEVGAILDQYVGILKDLGLKDFFEPVDQRVTLSVHTAVWKPDRRVFETALRRLGVQAELEECLLITEDAEHISACRELGMRVLQFGADFQDWSEAPTLIAQLAASGQ